MKIKYHKIRGVDPAVCTAEQMIAYNIAFRSALNGRDKYFELKARSGVAAADFIRAEIYDGIRDYTRAYDYKPGKYNIDGIFTALSSGLENYYNNYFIASNYETIGKCFRALYAD